MDVLRAKRRGDGQRTCHVPSRPVGVGRERFLRGGRLAAAVGEDGGGGEEEREEGDGEMEDHDRAAGR